MEEAKVLVVDCNPAMRAALCRLIAAQKDMRLLGDAGNGSEAIQKAIQLRPTIILMDANMPGKSGIQATQFIKKYCPGTKVVFLTMYDFYIEEAIAAGADGYLMKDCRYEELLSVIKDADEIPSQKRENKQGGDENVIYAGA